MTDLWLWIDSIPLYLRVLNEKLVVHFFLIIELKNYFSNAFILGSCITLFHAMKHIYSINNQYK